MVALTQRTRCRKLKDQTLALRERMHGLEPAGRPLVLEPGDFRPSVRWFNHPNQNCGGRHFSVRQFDGRLFVFRLQ